MQKRPAFSQAVPELTQGGTPHAAPRTDGKPGRLREGFTLPGYDGCNGVHTLHPGGVWGGESFHLRCLARRYETKANGDDAHHGRPSMCDLARWWPYRTRPQPSLPRHARRAPYDYTPITWRVLGIEDSYHVEDPQHGGRQRRGWW